MRGVGPGFKVCGGGVLIIVRKACDWFREHKLRILDRESQLRWYVCKGWVLRNFLRSGSGGINFDLEGI